MMKFLPLSLCLIATLARAELTDEQKKVPLEVDTTDASLAKVVLLAGPTSNKPGQHEYFAGCAMLMKCLKQTPGVWHVLAAEGWPKNEAVLKIYGDQGTIDLTKWATPTYSSAGAINPSKLPKTDTPSLSKKGRKKAG